MPSQHHGIVTLLAENFGQEKVAIRSVFHIQVVFAPKQLHDVWINRHGEVKWRLFGQQQTIQGSPKNLIKSIKRHIFENTSLGEMQVALALSKSIVDAGNLSQIVNSDHYVLCDAGFKLGKSRISVIAIMGGRVEAFSEPIEAQSCCEAECLAIREAMRRYPDMTIYNDSQSSVNIIDNPKVIWIDRAITKAADIIANLRG